MRRRTLQRRPRILLLLLLLAVPIGTLHAQTPAVRDSLLQLAQQERWIIRATLLHGDASQGRVTAFASGRLRIDGAEIRTDSIRSVARLRTKSPWRGAAWGGGIGAGVAVAVLVPFCSYGTEGHCDEAHTLFLTSAVTGAVIGALLSGLLSSDQWIRVWPSATNGR